MLVYNVILRAYCLGLILLNISYVAWNKKIGCL